MATILIFGGSGFIGSHLLRQLKLDKQNHLVVYDLRLPDAPLEEVEYIVGDVRRTINIDTDWDIKTIFNLAAVHREPGHETQEYYETNVLGAINVTAFARRMQVTQIVFTSSISVYGSSDQTKTERVAPAPVTAYGRSKYLAEEIHRSWAGEDSNRLIICRPAVIFGSGERGNFTRLASLLKMGFFIYPGRKDTIKAIFYVEDLVDTLVKVAKLHERLILYNACYSTRYTIEEIVNAFRVSYYPGVKTFLLPSKIVTFVATVLSPVSKLGLGVHPDRVMKLVRSTDIVPGWLVTHGYATPATLESALDRWFQDSDGHFV